MAVFQKITLNENVFNRLKGASGILQKGHNAHQSLKFVHVLIAFLSIVAAIVAIELVLWNRQVRHLKTIEKLDFEISFLPSYHIEFS